MDVLRDPTVVFTIWVVLAPIGLMVLENEHTFGQVVQQSLQGYLLAPTMLCSYAYLFLVVSLAHSGGRTVKLSPRDQRVARWFLMNGVYYNLFLDVVSGQFQANSLMTYQYNLIEPRYKFGPMDVRGQSVFWTSMCEIFFQSPFCILAYYGYVRGKAWRRCLEVIVSVLHIAGVWWFYVPEAYSNFPHLKGWPADWKESLTFHRVFYFWFGFWFMAAIWVTAAFMIGKTAFLEIASIIQASKTHSE